MSSKLFLSILTLFVLVSFPLISSVGASAIRWSQTYESGRFQAAHSLVETSDGGYAIAGSSGFYQVEDFCLVKTDEYGTMQWIKTYGGPDSEKAYPLVETSDGGYAIAGRTASFGAGSYDFWLVKTDANGTMQWNRTYGGPDSEEAYSLVETSDGGYAIAGDGLLVKTDAYGNMEWNQTYGGGSYYISNSLVETSDGGYVVAGGTRLIKTDAQGNMEWNQTYFMGAARSLVKTSDGGYAIAGDTDYYIAGDREFWLIKTDAYGNMEWKKTYGGENHDHAYSLVATSDGGYAFVIGSRFIKTDAQGNMEWTQTYEIEMGIQQPFSLIETSDGGYALAGYIWAAISGQTVFWVVKTDAQGIPEFPSWIILPLFLIATLVVTFCSKRLRVCLRHF